MITQIDYDVSFHSRNVVLTLQLVGGQGKWKEQQIFLDQSLACGNWAGVAKEKSGRRPGAGLMPAHRLQRWPDIKPASGQRLLFAEKK